MWYITRDEVFHYLILSVLSALNQYKLLLRILSWTFWKFHVFPQADSINLYLGLEISKLYVNERRLRAKQVHGINFKKKSSVRKRSVKLTTGRIIGSVYRFHWYKPEELLKCFLTLLLLSSYLLWLYVGFINFFRLIQETWIYVKFSCVMLSWLVMFWNFKDF